MKTMSSGLLLLVLSLIALSGCNASLDPGVPVPYRTLEQKALGGYEGEALLLSSREELVDFWNRQYKGSTPIPPLPDVDMSSSTVIVVGLGGRSDLCYNVGIGSVIDNGERTLVTVQEHRPGDNCLCPMMPCSPWLMIAIPIDHSSVIFQWEKVVETCK